MKTLSTGRITLTVPFDNGDTGTISFRPQDRGIQERIKEFNKNVEKEVEDLCKEKASVLENASCLSAFSDTKELIKMTEEDLKKAQESIDGIVEIEKAYNDSIKKEIDRIFDGKISEVAFRYCEPFDIVSVEEQDGSIERKPYVVNFFEWFAEQIAEQNAVNKKAMDKHLAKYRK